MLIIVDIVICVVGSEIFVEVVEPAVEMLRYLWKKIFFFFSLTILQINCFSYCPIISIIDIKMIDIKFVINPSISFERSFNSDVLVRASYVFRSLNYT